MTGSQSDTERLARAIIDMAEKDKGLVLSKLEDLIGSNISDAYDLGYDDGYEDAAEAVETGALVERATTNAREQEILNWTPKPLDRSFELRRNGKLSESQMTIIQGEIQKNFSARVTIKQEPYDHNTQYGLAAILDDGRMYAVKLKSTMTMAEITETLIRGLIADILGKAVDQPIYVKRK